MVDIQEVSLEELAEEVLGGPFEGAILLMQGDLGTKVWVNEARTLCHIEFSDGMVAHGLMTLSVRKYNG